MTPARPIVHHSRPHRCGAADPPITLSPYSRLQKGHLKIPSMVELPAGRDQWIEPDEGRILKLIAIISSFCAITLLSVMLTTTSTQSQSRPPPLSRCAPGNTGGGGCYNPGNVTCEDGQMCSAPLAICKKGPKGPGGCFNAGIFHYDSGQILSIGPR